MKKKLLVTGATGFIGRNLVNHFASIGAYEVIGTYHSRAPYKCPGVKFLKADLTQSEDLMGLMDGIDVVVHAAAVTSGAKDIVERPHIHIADTTLINSQVLKTAFQSKVSQFVFLSCSVMYKPMDRAVREDDFCEADELTPKYFAGASLKLYFEKLCRFYSTLYPSRFTVVRHSNIYGPHDKYNSDKSHVFAAQISKVCQATESVKVWGSGEEKRDFLYVDDLCQFIQLALEKQTEPFFLCNVASGVGVPIRDLVQKIIDLNGRNLKIEYDSSQPSIPVDIYLDSTRAKERFGWKPKVSLDDGIKKSIEFYRSNY